MDFITLCTKTRNECGVTGTETTVTNPTSGSEWERIIEWVKTAWNEIQISETEWKWMYVDFSFSTTVSTAVAGEYSPAEAGIPDLAEWKRDTFRIYDTAIGTADEQPLTFVRYNVFRDTYRFGTARDNTGRPTLFTITPDEKIQIWPQADADYTIVGKYYKTPSTLVNDSDTPEMPERFHDVIVYQAMLKYAGFESAPEVYSRAINEGKRPMSMLRIDQLPRPRRGGPLIR